MKAILYCRVSSEEQVKGFSLDAQESSGVEYAKRKGIQIVQTFKVAESASSEGRERFNEVVQILKHSKDIEILLVYKMDRAIRNLTDMTTLDELARNYNKQIHFFHENSIYEKNSSMGDFYKFGIMSVVSTGFSRNLSDVTKVGMMKKAESGIFPGPAPFGYRNNKEKRTIEIDPLQAPWVVRIKELAAEGYSIDMILVSLQNECCPYKFVRSKIERIAKSTFYHGLFEWSGQLHNGTYDPIVDIDLHEAAVSQIKRRAKGNQLKVDNIPYRGLMTCGVCGRAIVAERHSGKSYKDKNRYLYYRCGFARKGCENRDNVPLHVIEKQFFEALERLHVTEERAQIIKNELEDNAGKEVVARESKLAFMKAEAKRLETISDKAYEDHAVGKLTEEEWMRKDRKWKEQISKIKNEIRVLDTRPVNSALTTRTVIETMNSLKTQFESLPNEKKGELLKYVLSNPTLKDKTISFSYTIPFCYFQKTPEFANQGVQWDEYRNWLSSSSAVYFNRISSAFQ